MVLPCYSISTRRATLPAKAPGRVLPSPFPSYRAALLEAAGSVFRAGSTVSCFSWLWPPPSVVRSPFALLLYSTLAMALGAPGQSGRISPVSKSFTLSHGKVSFAIRGHIHRPWGCNSHNWEIGRSSLGSWARGTTWPSSGLTWGSIQPRRTACTAWAPCCHHVVAPGPLGLPGQSLRAQSMSHSVTPPGSSMWQAPAWLCVCASRRALMCGVCPFRPW